LKSASEADAMPYPDLSSIVLHLDRDGQRYAMYASSILIDEPLGKYFARDGDRLVIKRVYPEASTKVSVNSYRSQYVSLVQSGGIRDSEPAAEEAAMKDLRTRRIFIDAQGLRLRDLIADYNLWPEPGSDVMIKLYREKQSPSVLCCQIDERARAGRRIISSTKTLLRWRALLRRQTNILWSARRENRLQKMCQIWIASF
jgi:hypothetical protein